MLKADEFLGKHKVSVKGSVRRKVVEGVEEKVVPAWLPRDPVTGVKKKNPEYWVKYRKEHPEAIKAIRKRYEKRRAAKMGGAKVLREHKAHLAVQNYWKDPEHKRKLARKYREKNREASRTACREYSKRKREGKKTRKYKRKEQRGVSSAVEQSPVQRQVKGSIPLRPATE